MAIAKIRGSNVCAGTSTRQLIRLKTTTVAHGAACQRRTLNPSSNSARANSQNTTTFPVETAINTACHGVTGGANPELAVTAWAAEPSANAVARRPAATALKSRNRSAASSTSSVAVPVPSTRSICDSISQGFPAVMMPLNLVQSISGFNLLHMASPAICLATSPIHPRHGRTGRSRPAFRRRGAGPPPATPYFRSRCSA